MNKNAVYLAAFGVLCVLVGVVVGAGIVRKTNLPCFGPERPNFAKRAERFMCQGPKGLKGKGGLFTMLTTKLDLDQDQRVKVREILEQTRQEINKVGEGVRNTIANIKEKGDKQIMDTLSPQQQEKFRALLKEFKKRHKLMEIRGDRGPMMGHGPRPQE